MIYAFIIYHNVFCIYVFVYVYVYMFYGGLAIVATVVPTENDSDVIFVFNNCYMLVKCKLVHPT